MRFNTRMELRPVFAARIAAVSNSSTILTVELELLAASFDLSPAASGTREA
jgi:hypothetical protein